jgi:hypothetical protein
MMLYEMPTGIRNTQRTNYEECGNLIVGSKLTFQPSEFAGGFYEEGFSEAHLNLARVVRKYVLSVIPTPLQDV